MAEFKDRIKELRLYKGERQADVAQVVGVSVPSLSSYEMGREPNFEVLGKLAKHFSCSTDYLLGLSDDYICNTEHGELPMSVMKRLNILEATVRDYDNVLRTAILIQSKELATRELAEAPNAQDA